MKTELIQEICTLMRNHLSDEQNTLLERTLNQVLKISSFLIVTIR